MAIQGGGEESKGQVGTEQTLVLQASLPGTSFYRTKQVGSMVAYIKGWPWRRGSGNLLPSPGRQIKGLVWAGW